MTLQADLIYCFDCKQYLSSNQFAKRKKSINGYQPRCLSCASRRISKWKSKKRKEELKNIGQLMLFVGGTN